MNASRYKMKMDKRVKWITSITMVVLIGFFVYFYMTSGGSYLPGWFTLLIMALIALLGLSIPKFINITHNSLEIHCIMELTQIPKENIKSIEIIAKSEMDWCIPVPFLGIWGVFGYYGYYFDFKNFKLFRLFAKQWSNFVKIEDIYEEVTVIAMPDPERLIEQIKK